MHQHPGDGDGQGHVGLELDGGGGGHHQGQEEEGPIPGYREDGEGRGAFLQYAGHLQHHGQQLEHGAADDGRDEGGHGADQGVEDGGAHAAQAPASGSLRKRSLPTALGQQGQHFAIGVGDGVADDHLTLVVRLHHPEHARDGLEGRAIDPGGIAEHKAQPRHAVGHGDDVVGAAECGDDGTGQSRIVF